MLSGRWRRLLPLTGPTPAQSAAVLAGVTAALPPARGRPWSQPLPTRVLLTPAAPRTNLTERALAAVLGTSQSTVNRVITHLTPVLARLLPTPGPAGTRTRGTWIVDSTLIPVHDHDRTAPSRNYQRSVNAQVVIREADHSPVCPRARPGPSSATAATAA